MPTWQSEKSKRTGSAASISPQRRGDLRRHLPPGARVARQAQAASEPDDMGVERHHQARRRQLRPHRHVDGVLAHHPAQEQVEPLAGAARRRPRKEVGHAGAGGTAASVGRRQIGGEGAGREGVERGVHVGRRRIVAGHEEPFNRAVLAQHALQDDEQRHQIAATDPAVHERRQHRTLNGRVEGADKRRRARTHHAQQRLHRLQHARHAPEGQRGGAEADDLAVLARRVPPHDVNRVERRVDVIERPVDGVEPLLQHRLFRARGRRQNAVIGTPARHSGHEPASWFSGALYSASATFGTPASKTASMRS